MRVVLDGKTLCMFSAACPDVFVSTVICYNVVHVFKSLGHY